MQAGFVREIEDLNLNFKNIEFIIDRYTVVKSKVSPTTFTGDGSTMSFELDEIVHEEDILVKVGSTVQVHKTDFHLTHNTSTVKTTIVFKLTAPSNGDVIRVERTNDKYLRFKDIT